MSRALDRERRAIARQVEGMWGLVPASRVVAATGRSALYLVRVMAWHGRPDIAAVLRRSPSPRRVLEAEVLESIHRCPVCGVWTCAPRFQRVPHRHRTCGEVSVA